MTDPCTSHGHERRTELQGKNRQKVIKKAEAHVAQRSKTVTEAQLDVMLVPWVNLETYYIMINGFLTIITIKRVLCHIEKHKNPCSVHQ